MMGLAGIPGGVASPNACIKALINYLGAQARILEKGGFNALGGCIAARGKARTKFLFYFVFNSVSGKEGGF